VSSHYLHDRLDDAFSVITPTPAPVDAAMHEGRRIRWRRRALAAASVAVAASVTVAVVAAAVVVPPAAEFRQPSPAPSTGPGQYTVTVQPPGPHSPAGLIASGTVNGKPWQVSLVRESFHGTLSLPLIDTTGAAFGSHTGKVGGFPSQMRVTAPIVFRYDWDFGAPAQEQYGVVRADVAYAKVRFGNGTVLTLHPVTIYGMRSVAFAAPMGVPIVDVTAYSSSGEIATSIPLVLPGNAAYFGNWLTPGQQVPARVSDVIASGENPGGPWWAAIYIGPWGTCAYDAGLYCQTPKPMPIAVLTKAGWPPASVIAAVAPSVARLVLSLHAWTRQVKPVVIGGQRFIICRNVPNIPDVIHWTAYDAAGKVIGTGVL
jgi:hypothetical protein